MSSYTYPTSPNITFGARDLKAPGDVAKRISGTAFDAEFGAIALFSTQTLSNVSPSFTGTMTGGGVVDGGTF
jgi:hypothetical protein